MTKQRLALFILALAVTVGGAFYGAGEIHRHRELIAAEGKRVERLQQQLTALQDKRNSALREFADYETQHALSTGSSQIAADSRASSAQAGETREWLVRLKRIKASFEEAPDQKIPELALLSDLEWLTIARQTKGDSELDLRRARAAAREIAVNRFMQHLREALRAYTTFTNGVLPSHVGELQSFFKAPFDPAALARYEMRSFGNVNDRKPHSDETIAERTPVDEDYDQRHAISGIDGSSTNPWAMNFLRDAITEAQRALSASHQGKKSASESDLLPFVRDPTARTILQAMAEYQQKHHGQTPRDLAELRGYVKDPAAQAKLERIILAQQPGDRHP
jgi:hypothetical protein